MSDLKSKSEHLCSRHAGPANIGHSHGGGESLLSDEKMDTDMPWIKLDDAMFYDEKIGSLSPIAKLTWVYLLCEAKRANRAGEIPTKLCSPAIVASIIGAETPMEIDRAIAAIIECGLATKVTSVTIAITNWGKYQTDPNATDRSRKYRESLATVTQQLRHSDATVTQQFRHGARVDKSRVDQTEIRQDNTRKEYREAPASLSDQQADRDTQISDFENAENQDRELESEDHPKRTVDKLTVIATDIVKYWREKCGHSGAIVSRDRVAKVAARLREGLTESQIRAAIDGCAQSNWHNGDNPSGKKYNDIALICRNAAKVEQFAALLEYVEPPQYGEHAPQYRDPTATVIKCVYCPKPLRKLDAVANHDRTGKAHWLCVDAFRSAQISSATVSPLNESEKNNEVP